MPQFERPREVEGPLVTGFAGRLLKVDGTVRPGGVILTPLAALDWDGDGFEAALNLDPLPEFILLGTGDRLVRPSAADLAPYEVRGVGVEVMDTRAAARAWSLLRSEGRWISAALRGL